MPTLSPPALVTLCATLGAVVVVAHAEYRRRYPAAPAATDDGADAATAMDVGEDDGDARVDDEAERSDAAAPAASGVRRPAWRATARRMVLGAAGGATCALLALCVVEGARRGCALLHAARIAAPPAMISTSAQPTLVPRPVVSTADLVRQRTQPVPSPRRGWFFGPLPLRK